VHRPHIFVVRPIPSRPNADPQNEAIVVPLAACYYCLQKKCTVLARATKKTLCTMQFGSRTFVLFVDAVATVCSIVPTHNWMLQGEHSDNTTEHNIT
jgi:hypothetical protein